MKKIILQIFVFLTTIFLLWWGLSQIDWKRNFGISDKTKNTEEKLGELFLDIFKGKNEETKNKDVLLATDSILNTLCRASGINREKIKLHVLESSQINAFALPDGHMVIFTGLIAHCDKEEELIGVMAHELGHIELNHIMKKLIREVGLSALITMTSGGSGELAKEAAHQLASSAYSRELEKEADLNALTYLENANIDPEPFAEFLYKISSDEPEIVKKLKWINSHPDSEERAVYLVEEIGTEKKEYETILGEALWERVRELSK